MAILGFDPPKLDAISLSQGHFDHFFRMDGFFEIKKGRIKGNLTVFF